MTTALHPRTTTELAELLRNRPGRVRLLGTGTRQARLPAADGAVALYLSGLDAIERLDAPDQTCSVGAGLSRDVLDAELLRHRLELPLAGAGSIGGLFASDDVGAVTAGGPAPRTLLLGMEAVLADGTVFRSGARVVKSVAGFDVHKLLVGSRGRLFAATTLHLRLRPRPRASVWFRREGLDASQALRLFLTLRALAVPPMALHLRTDAAGAMVAGRIAGRAAFVASTLRAHGLAEGPPVTELHLHAPAAGEVLTGIVVPSRAVELFGKALAIRPTFEEARRFRAVLLARLQQFSEAVSEINVALQAAPKSGAILYAAACVISLTSEHAANPAAAQQARNESLRFLRQALEHGYGRQAATDNDLAGLRQHPDFEKLLLQNH